MASRDISLQLIEHTISLFDAAATELGDVALRAYATRGLKRTSYKAEPARMLDEVRTTAHIAKVRIEVLIKDGDLDRELSERAIHYRDQLDTCIRAALYILRPDQYAFCEQSLAEALA